jgi:hypothetical protein
VQDIVPNLDATALPGPRPCRGCFDQPAEKLTKFFDSCMCFSGRMHEQRCRGSHVTSLLTELWDDQMHTYL